MHCVARYRSRAQRAALILACLWLAGCSAQPAVKVVDLPLPKPPAGTMDPPARLPKLPDREMTVGELAGEVASLQTRYGKETGRLRTLQRYVRRVHKTRRAK